MRVELLCHAGCRSAPAALQLVRECLSALGTLDPVLVRVGDYLSPTVLVNGTDVMRPATRLSEGSACRIDVPTGAHSGRPESTPCRRVPGRVIPPAITR
jgi:hypothetical protein